MAAIVVDVETSGFPQSFKSHYSNLESYSTARIVSIAWMLVDADGIVQEQHYHVIRPENFQFDPESVDVHGISHESAMKEGIPFADMLETLTVAIDQANTFVAHNVSFDRNVLLSELYRRKYRDQVDRLKAMRTECTMLMGKRILKLERNPRLGDLYARLMGKQMRRQHHAKEDMLACFKCWQHLHMRQTQLQMAQRSSSDDSLPAKKTIYLID